ncbi:MAG: translation initiation factor 2 [Gammaproteobacteria bacterium HGW-Gammaproteobacteria-11]|nr:MAG: translation initiation factor 2 [Gammaproteobacteria bacterium HGW-Gammaproteobacteria-11]
MLVSALLLACLGSLPMAMAEEPVVNDPDIGALQAELASVEAARQALEDQLKATTNSDLIERLEQENQALRERQADQTAILPAALEQDRQQWFLIGGITVFASLLIGFILARLGGGRRRREWLN